MKLFKLLIVILFVIISLNLSGCKSKEKTTSPEEDYDIKRSENYTQVYDDIYVLQSSYFLTNIVIVVSMDKAVLIDTGMDIKDREKIENFINEKGLIIEHLVLTHPHDDHKGNYDYFKNLYNLPELSPYTIENQQEIKLNDITLRLIFTEGHYDKNSHISVELPEKNILIAGDIVCNNILPPISSGNGNFFDLVNTLNDIKNKNYVYIIPGHGEVDQSNIIIDRQLEYLNNVQIKIQEIINNGGNITDVEDIKLEDCISDTSYLNKNRITTYHRYNLRAIYNQIKE